MIQSAERRCAFDYSANLAERCNVLLPATCVKGWLSNFNLLWQDLGKSLSESINDFVVHLDFSFTQFNNSLELLYFEVGVTSCSKLIIHLEDPSVHVQIINYQPGKCKLEFSSVLNVIGTHWDGYVTELENTLCSTLGRVNNVSSSLIRLTAHDRHSELN